MNTIQLDILRPHWVEFEGGSRRYVDEASLSIIIDNTDIFTMEEFKDDYEGASPLSFLKDEYINYESPFRSVFRGLRLIGVCGGVYGCRCEGCEDLIARVTTDENVTKWKIIPVDKENIRKNYSFNANEYRKQIEMLEKNYFSRLWEDNACRIRRLCNKYIECYVTKSFKVLDGVRILSFLDKEDELSDNMTVYYYDDFEKMGSGYGRPFRGMDIKWDGKTLESAISNLRKFAETELIQLNKNEINKLKNERNKTLSNFLMNH
jgi:hypothetical protein